jgi:hypothetical protein
LRFALLLAAVSASPLHAQSWCTVPPADARVAFTSHPFSLPPSDAQQHAIADIHVEGTLHPSEAVLFARRDLTLMRRAALAWRANGDRVQFDVARRLLTAWVDTYRPNLNPIDETEFDRLIDTFGILSDSVPPADRQRIAAWLDTWGWAYIHSIHRLARPNHTIWINNWQSHRIKLITLIAATTDDKRLLGEARHLFQRQIAANIHPDGETLDFFQRDALHYVVYDLDPLLRAALVARRFSGEDWYHWETTDHASLARAVAWLLPYATGRFTHEEFVHSQVDFDAQRAAAGMKGFKGLFDVHNAAETYWLASRFDPALEPLARSLGPEPDYLAMCSG